MVNGKYVRITGGIQRALRRLQQAGKMLHLSRGVQMKVDDKGEPVLDELKRLQYRLALGKGSTYRKPKESLDDVLVEVSP
jgi:hypothetical protein